MVCILFYIIFYKTSRRCIHIEKVVGMHTAYWVCQSLIPSIATVACGSLPKTVFNAAHTESAHFFDILCRGLNMVECVFMINESSNIY